MPQAEVTTSPIADDEAIPETGTVIGGRYVVEELLGMGGMSVVFRARDLRLGHLVALKILQGSRDRRSDHTRRFLREARIIAQLRSDHVVSVLDVDTTSQPPYLAMELLEGHTVGDLLTAHGRFSTAVALRIVVQACRGVFDAHALGVMHRDLKPSNLIVARSTDGGQRVKVIDFGISKPFLRNSTEPSLTSTGEILGSPRYMSPEQVRSGGTIDARSDIWALGAILYELLTGVSPFEAPTVADTLARIVRDIPTPLRELVPEVPGRVASIVALCLSKDPALRPPDVRSLLDELEAVTPPGALTIDEIPAGARVRTWGATTQKTGDRSWSLSRNPSPPRRSRRGVIAGIGVFAGLATWLVLRAISHSPAPLPLAATSATPPSLTSASPPSEALAAPPVTTPIPPAPPAMSPEPPSRSQSHYPVRSRPAGALRAAGHDAGPGDDDLELNRRD